MIVTLLSVLLLVLLPIGVLIREVMEYRTKKPGTRLW